MPTLSPAAPAAAFPAVCAMPAHSVPALSYRRYAEGCDPGDEGWLELPQCLYTTFDQRFPSSLLTAVLSELNPAVQLLTVTESDGTRRRDWPWLSDESLDAVEARCAHYTGRLTPRHELHEVLRQLNAACEPRPMYGAARVQAAA